jgi:hypothetical protein
MDFVKVEYRDTVYYIQPEHLFGYMSRDFSPSFFELRSLSCGIIRNGKVIKNRLGDMNISPEELELALATSA